MNKELIINSAADGVEIALLEDKKLVEIHNEKMDARWAVGDLYLGKVKKIIPGLNAAFVDVGFEKDAFLHYTDLSPYVKSIIQFTHQAVNDNNNSFDFTKFETAPEIVKTGKISEVEIVLKDPKYSLQMQLGKLYGVGPVKINELMNNITSFEELYDKKDELLNDKQKIGLLYYNDMSLRIPISEGKKHYKIIDKIFKKSNDNIEFELVGSYRRQNKDMGDIDILIKNSNDLNLKTLISNLISTGYIIETLANGKSKFMGLCKLSPKLPARRIDILIAEPSYYYFALLYFTGSYTFNIYMRKIALEKGYSLSEYGLKDKTKKYIDTSELIKTEEDIFKFLDIPYVPPNERNIV